MKKSFFIFLLFCFCGCSHSSFKASWTKEMAPASFVARFETSKGDFEIEVTRNLSPLAASPIAHPFSPRGK